jgi:Phytanoyl-CoA dioxygenase (PhyH)
MAPSNGLVETNGHVQTNGDAPVRVANVNGAAKDVDHVNFGNPIDNKQLATEEQYLEAIDAIRAKLPKLAELKALIELDLTSGHPPIFIDARGTPTTLNSSTDEPSVHLRTRPETILHLIEGLMEVRYADHFNHIEAKGEQVELAVKFGDLISPVQPASPSPPVGRLPEPTTDIKQVKADLKEFGYGFVKDALSPVECATLAKRLSDQAAGERKAGVAYFDGGPLKPNQRIWNLPNKGQEFLDLLDHPLVAEFMSENLGNGYHLSSYTANINRPGSKGMGMHHDQITINPAIPQFPLGVNLMWFLEEVTEENGGTRILPRSHKGLVAPMNLHDIGGTIAAQGPAGTCLVFESRLWHATGPNTAASGERPVILQFYVRHFVRPQENFTLSVLPEVEAKLTRAAQQALGFTVTATLGGVEGFRPDGTVVSRPEKPIGILNP